MSIFTVMWLINTGPYFLYDILLNYSYILSVFICGWRSTQHFKDGIHSMVWWLIWLTYIFPSLFLSLSFSCSVSHSFYLSFPLSLIQWIGIIDDFLGKAKKKLLNIIYTKCVCLCKYDTVLLNEPKSQIKSYKTGWKKTNVSHSLCLSQNVYLFSNTAIHWKRERAQWHKVFWMAHWNRLNSNEPSKRVSVEVFSAYYDRITNLIQRKSLSRMIKFQWFFY